MEDFVKIVLTRVDLANILEGLHDKMMVWRSTEEYVETGYVQSADCAEACDDPCEARAIADYYLYLIETIKKQMAEQGAKVCSEKY
jgi:hypothetical protein